MERIVYMGTPDFAVPALKALLASPYEVAAVVTQPDKPKGRKGTPVPSPVKEVAVEAGIPVLQPVKARDPAFVQELSGYAPDLIVVAAFGQILPKSILELPRYGCVNLHASLLPKYRGAAPIQWAILDGETETGVTLMQMNEGLDTGDSLAKVVVPIEEEDTGGSLFDKLSAAGGALLVQSLPKLFAGQLEAQPQPAQSPTPYASMLKKEMGQMDFSQEAVVLARKVRGLNPWPSAYTSLGGKTLKVWEAQAEGARGGKGGEVLEVRKDGILVACGQGSLLLKEVQLEGKKRMAAADFLRGYQLHVGEMLGE